MLNRLLNTMEELFEICLNCLEKNPTIVIVTSSILVIVLAFFEIKKNYSGKLKRKG